MHHHLRVRCIAGLLVCLLTGVAVTAAKVAETARPSAGKSSGVHCGVGGVALFKAAELLTPVDVSGARAEWANDRIELVTSSGSRLKCPPLDKEYVALSIRCVFGGEEDVPGKLVGEDERCILVSTGRERYGEVVWNKQFLPRPWKSVPIGSSVKLPAGPGVGILSTPEPSRERITYYGPIRNTRMGKTLMEADIALGSMMEGVDGVSGQVVDYARVPGFMTLIERQARNSAPSSPGSSLAEKKPWWQSGSTWYVLIPDRFTLKFDRDAARLDFAETRMKVIAWTGTADALDRSSEEFAGQVSERYQDLAAVHPPLGALVDAAKAVCFVRWMREAGVSADLDWARDCPIQQTETVEYQSRVRVESLSDRDGKPLIEKPSVP
ncbi:MAG: hypothetical protein JNL96_20865 [Planctomycetaceae bacterium]|nr:hypothetical protein [Planctomycetaceae bacterium]